MNVVTESAIVYRGAGRRFFTRKAAVRSFAKAAVRKRCDCDPTPYLPEGSGYVCGYHATDYGMRLIERFTSLYGRSPPKPSAELKP